MKLADMIFEISENCGTAFIVSEYHCARRFF